MQDSKVLSSDTVDGPGTVSVILPVMNETWSLEKTVRVLIDENRRYLKEILIITSPRTIQESLNTINQLTSRNPSLIRVHEQTLAYLGGAIQEGFLLARGRYTILMASDLETDPHLVNSLISEITRGDFDIIVASRWLAGHGFVGYSLLKYMSNFIFQKIFATLYRVSLTDLTYGFRIYRTEIIKKIIWNELKHSFLLESLVKPLRLGCGVKEIPAKWIARKEGASQNMLSAYLGYFKIGLRVVLTDPQLFLKKTESATDCEKTACA